MCVVYVGEREEREKEESLFGRVFCVGSVCFVDLLVFFCVLKFWSGWDGGCGAICSRLCLRPIGVGESSLS